MIGCNISTLKSKKLFTHIRNAKLAFKRYEKCQYLPGTNRFSAFRSPESSDAREGAIEIEPRNTSLQNLILDPTLRAISGPNPLKTTAPSNAGQN